MERKDAENEFMTYDEAVAALSAMMERGWRLELDRMVELCRRLGVPGGGTPKFVHVAGTNGKGSVTAYVQNMLAAQGYVTGAYYSPYVYDLRERVQIGLEWIEKDTFARLMSRIVEVGDAMVETTFGGPTEFEAKTALGFLAWQEAGCEAVALEVGLGGRLDATNVVDPACSVIVSIGYDHMHILGDTLGAIAGEKAGIIKPGKPVVVGDLPDEAWEAVAAVAEAKGAPVWKFGREFDVTFDCDSYRVYTPHGSTEGLQPGMIASVQPHNMAVAWAAVEAAGLMRDREAAKRGVAATRLPGRFERYRGKQDYILDGAHNREAAAALAESLKWDEGVGFIVGMLKGHDPGPFFKELSACSKYCAIVPVPNERSYDPAELAAIAKLSFSQVKAFESVDEALRWLHRDPIVITGSFYLLSAAKEALLRWSPIKRI